MTGELTLPPLMWAQETATDAMEHAAMQATLGCDAGLLSHAIGATQMQAALVFSPEVPLGQAMTMLPLCGVSFQNALGALAPPEVAVHLDWNGGLRINGASCGDFRVLASESDAQAIPDWLVVGFTLPLIPGSDDTGETPDRTALYSEGCADVAPRALLEAWARHTLNWIARWESEGAGALRANWRGLAHGIGEQVEQNGLTGTFLGVDDGFSMLLRIGDETRTIPLVTLLENTR